MSSPERIKFELLEIDKCDGDICSKGDSGVFVNSDGGTKLLPDSFSVFQQWKCSTSSSGQTNSTSVSDRHTDRSNDSSLSPGLNPQDAQNGPVTGAASGAGECVTRGRPASSELYLEEDLRAPRFSIVDCLLVELYDTYSSTRRRVDSLDSSTEASSSEPLCRSNTGSSFLQELQEKHTRRHQVNYLSQKAPEELRCIIAEVRYRTALQSAKLLRQLKRRDRLAHKLQKNYDIITACLQATSQKRRVDTRLKFTIEPSLGKNGFQQWYDALKAVARLPTGIPEEWRKRVWLTLADQYLHSISIDWDKTLRFAFNERSNPDDDSLGIQIVKDLHRTGCSSYSGQEGEQDRVVLKRVLLAFARWNKAVGYCQGFNVLAALILEVTEGNESDALKVMIYLIDKVLPDSYFANNLRSLSVDMAVFRDLLRMKLPHLSQHLHHLQKTANQEAGGSYEPPLTNVFTMQWFLTMFATCLPPKAVLKIWDSVFFEGSEVLLRVGLAIWSHLGERIVFCQTADEFYSTMGRLTQEMLEHSLIDCAELMQNVYSMAEFPFPQLAELREKYTYNITPFPTSQPNGSSGLGGWESDEDGFDDDEDGVVTALGCLGPLGGLLAPEIQRYQRHLKDQRGGEHGGNMAELSPGAVGSAGLGSLTPGGSRAEHQAAINSMLQERMSTDISALRKQYSRIKKRQQQQASLLYIRTDKCPATSVFASQLHPSPVVNHLLLGRKPKGGTRGMPSPSSLQTPPAPLAHSSPANPNSSQRERDRGRNRLVSQAENSHSRLGSPWRAHVRAHVRAHRRNIARARAQLGFADTDEGKEEGTKEAGDEAEEDDYGENDDEEVSPSPAIPLQGSSEEVPAATEQEEHEEEDDKAECLESLEQTLTPHPSSPDHGSPHPSSPDHGSPHPSSPDHGSPHPSSPDHGSPHPSSPDQGSPHPSSPDQGSPHPSSPDQGSPHPTSPDQGSPHPTSPDQGSPHPSSPDHGSPHPSSPDHGSPHPSSPDQGSPHPSSPDHGSPHPSSPDHGSPHPSSPDHGPPDDSHFIETIPALSSISTSSNHLSSPALDSLRAPPPRKALVSPFPCVKQPRKSAAARNLGLYGPTGRTPTVHFPQLSLNRTPTTVPTRRR
ncbi:TBC1 domain family member 30 [Esox lucius]|uniref:TBC1 domain family member 30 n=1 Tax=Esox lucius TaxID=8010 RepID=A0A3P8Y2C3_ESOLU|nr:TBC1 domain family member 30 [Esox lucius]